MIQRSGRVLRQALARVLMLAVITTGLVIASGPVAQACSCRTSTTQEFFDGADVVVTGTIDDPDSLGVGVLSAAGFLKPEQYDVTVSQVYKGERVGPVVAVFSDPSGASCGWERTDGGGSYLIFASYDDIYGKPSDELWGFLCGGTQESTPDLLEDILLIAGTSHDPDPSIAGPADPDRPLIVGLATLGALGAAAVLWLRRRRRPI